MTAAAHTTPTQHRNRGPTGTPGCMGAAMHANEARLYCTSVRREQATIVGNVML